jgi:effector-binding domain-containing protein
MEASLGPAIQEVMETLARRDIPPAGPVFAHHFRMDPERFDFEVGVPVDMPFAETDKPAGRVIPGHLPAQQVARTIYHGPYEGLPAAWEAFMTWIKDNGYIVQPDLWECYLDNPGTVPDGADLRTELNRPVSALASLSDWSI